MVELAEVIIMLCNMCPRRCNVDRDETLGACGCGSEISVSRTVRHFWEEPCISGKNGSGAIFFSGCNLKCIYCQNYSISRGIVGKELSKSEFQSLLMNISESGAHNINLVTPTHFTMQIAEALSEIKSDLKIPIVWNTSGYETEESVEALKGLVDIFLCDVKYFSDEFAVEYSHAPNYFVSAKKAIEKMVSITGKPTYDDNGLMKSGVILRHLVLPGGRHDSESILTELAHISDSVVLSLMCQYTPTPSVESHKLLSRRVASLEYNHAVKCANKLGFNGYIQDKTSAKSEYTPDFEEKWDFVY